MLMDYFDGYAGSHRAYKGGKWCYEDGCVYRGLELLHRATGEARWFDHLGRLVDQQIGDGPSLSGYDPNDYNIDNIMSGRALLYLHEVTGQPVYLDAARLLALQLESHPRTRSGVYWHKLRYPWQVWLDGLYMGAPFQIAYAKRTGNDALVIDALNQVEKALKLTWVPETELYSHAYDEARKQPWADPESGQSPPNHWARALGWLAMALVDIAELVGPEDFARLREPTRSLLDRIAKLRVPGKLWLQVIDQPDLPGNFEESSASAMFAYAFAKGRLLGLFDGDIESVTATLLERSVASSPLGQTQMNGICHVAGLGLYQGRYRDGTAEYYVSEACVPDDPKGVGPLMMTISTGMDLKAAKHDAVAGR